jgi:hypothetical protein
VPGSFPSATPAGGRDGTAGPTGTPEDAGRGGTLGAGSTVGTPPGGGSSDSSGGTSATTGGNGSGGAATGGAGWGGLASALRILGVDKPPVIGMWPMLVGTTGAVTMAFAFAIFGKKRRDEEPPAPDEVLQASAARGHDAMPQGEAVAGVVRTPVVPMPLDGEAGMPRWRRPSLLQARKADPARSVSTAARQSFQNAATATAAGVDRRVIRYRLVRLLDAPDELRSAEIGQLDQGDEVQLLERSGSYWLVLCPDGRQGWLHKMTLGETVGDGAANPLGGDVDEDVLSAFIRARARARA